jgi:hypothetical protein
MATSLMTFIGKSFWIHNAVAEVWFSSFVRTANRVTEIPVWLQLMLNEITPALEHNWVDGIAMHVFDDHIDSPQRVEDFLSLLLTTNAELLKVAGVQRIVSVDKFDAASEFLIPEIQMIEVLFRQPEQLHEPWKIFTVPDGWRIA